MLTPVKHSLRILRRDPVFATVAICSLALGIGATSSMFTFADAMLLRPLPVLRPDRVVSINTATSAPFTSNTTVSYPDYADLRDRNRTFEGLVAASFAKLSYSATPHALPRMKLGLYVSGNFFRVLGVEPALGRGFRPDEDQAEGRDALVVLGHNFWVSQFGASRSVLGSHIRLNGVDFTVIGVAPEHFTGIDPLFRPPLFIPLAMAPRLEPQNLLHNRDAGWLFVKGRLKPGVSLRQAQGDIGAIAPELLKLHKQPEAAERLVVETELQLRTGQWPEVSAMLSALGVLALCVLAIACANVAGLLLSRARGRSREIAVRLAIGAGRWALVRQLLLENLLVALAGGAAGILVADAFAGFWRRAQLPTDLPIVLDMAVDQRVLLFTLGVSVLSTLLFGLAPALRITRPDLVAALKASDADSAGRRHLWGRNTIVVGQVALSMVLLVVSSVLVQGFHDRLAQGPGFRIDRLFLASFDPRLARYSEDQTRRFYKDLLERTHSAPGVRLAALTSLVPMTGVETLGIVPAGYSLRRGERSFPVLNSYVSEGYFETMDIPILRGRGLLESDGERSPLVAVVNEHLARHYWPGRNALGQRFHLGDAAGKLVEIVGIARMSRYAWIAEAPADFVYLPIGQHPRSVLTLVAESSAPDAAIIAPALSAVVRGIDPDMPVFEARTMREIYARVAVWNAAAITDMVGGLGLTGLVLAVVGLYGLVAYSVSRRTREIGIRIAIGADPRKVVWMVLRQGLRLGAAGVAAGLPVAFLACRGITSAVGAGAEFQAGLVDYAVIALPLLLITALAALAPARSASRVDPIRALREE
ncbi:MAG: ABC transporter permease [Bryobacteraceae bacterium]|jgi:predicted permease